MKRYRQALLRECLGDFVRFCCIVPYADRLVTGACDDELLSDAHI